MRKRSGFRHFLLVTAAVAVAAGVPVSVGADGGPIPCPPGGVRSDVDCLVLALGAPYGFGTPQFEQCATTNPGDVSENFSSTAWSVTVRLTCFDKLLVSSNPVLTLNGTPLTSWPCQTGTALAFGSLVAGGVKTPFPAILTNTPAGVVVTTDSETFEGQGVIVMSEESVQHQCSAPVAGGTAIAPLVAAVAFNYVVPNLTG